MSNPRLPTEVYRVLEEECDKRPGLVRDDRVFGDLLNAVAWRTRHLGMGLSRKSGGRHVDSPVGPIAEDVLQDRDTGHHWDVLIAAAVGNPLDYGNGPPTSIGIMTDPNRPWVAPVQPSGQPAPVPTPTPTPHPTPTPRPHPQPSVDLSGVHAALARIEAKMDGLQLEQADTAGKLQHTIDNLFQSDGDSPSMLEHMDDTKRIVLGLPRDEKFR